MKEKQGPGKLQIMQFVKRERSFIAIVILCLGLCLFALTQIKAQVGSIIKQYNEYITNYCTCAGFIVSGDNMPLINITSTGTVPGR